MTPDSMTAGSLLLAYAAIAIIALVVLIARYRLNPFITLTLVSLGLALMKARVGETIRADLPRGARRYEIIEIIS